MDIERKYPRLAGRTGILVLVAVVALAVGVVAGLSFSSRLGTGGGASSSAVESGGEQWYTCGMHPNVLQKTPGNCPICQMKLTPLKQDSGDDSGGGGGGASKERKVLYWRAPMNPGYISQKPGKSPMGMDLIPVYAKAGERPSSHDIRIDPVTIQNMGLRTAVIQRSPLIKTIRTVGRVDYDEQLVSFVDTKFSGWIETLYVDETGQAVRWGEKLFDVYSPELYAAQEEFLAAARNLPLLDKSTFAPAREEAIKLVEAAVTKLKYMDVSDKQIHDLRESGRVEKTLAIHAPADGIVTEKMALEGMYVKPGMRLYTLADLSRVWVYVDVYEYQLPWVRVGQDATMTLPYVAGKHFLGKVVYIYPYLDEKTRVIKVRLEFENPGLELKPGMYANVRLESQLDRNAILIPREAYIDSGTRQVVFVVRGEGKFAPRDIQVGVEAEDGMVEVLDGLDAGEVVVTSGQFMLDAESKLKEAVAKMMEVERAKPSSPTAAAGSSAKGGGMDMSSGSMSSDDRASGDKVAGGKMAGSRSGAVIPDDAKYACPMESHKDEEAPANQGPYFSAEPGTCPRCGMKLKPLADLDWVGALRAAGGGDVAYTCPDHPHVFSQQSGTCPRCGNPLEPFKVMYTCPNPEHAGEISPFPGECSHCGRELTPFRGVWLDDAMAGANVPVSPLLAEKSPYYCPTHPLVHSDTPGRCTICGAVLVSRAEEKGAGSAKARSIPAGSKYVCAMEKCWEFSAEPGQCSKCGMRLRPIERVEWAQELVGQSAPGAAGKDGSPEKGSSEKSGSEKGDSGKGDAEGGYTCPMHPQVRSAQTGKCAICGMRLVKVSTLTPPVATGHIATQMDSVVEYYLEIQKLLASDREQGLVEQAQKLASVSETLLKHFTEAGVDSSSQVEAAARRMHAAALKITGKLDSDRVIFVEMSAALGTLIQNARPDRQRWPKLYRFHCPMTKGDWYQPTEEKANPYYGFKMLSCGELQAVE